MKIGGVFVVALGIAAAAFGASARADMAVSGPTSGAGSYSITQLADLGASKPLYSFGGVTGIALWDILGGAAAANPNAANWGGIATSTPPGNATNNAILRYYVQASGADGDRSVVSLGEIAPFFGGVSQPIPAFIAFKTTSDTLLAAPELIIPGYTGRNIDQLTNIELLSVASLPSGVRGTPSVTLELKGDAVTSPGVYTRADLQNMGSAIDVVASNNTYTGIPLWDFLNPNTTDVTDKLVVIKGTDGYQVVHALAELDPSKGGDPFILLAYADTGTDLNDPPVPGTGDSTRTILPEDTMRRGRWMSNTYEIDVIDAPTPTPLPASWTMMLLGLGALGIARRRHAKKQLVTRQPVCA